MASATVVPAGSRQGPLTNPRPFLYAGLGAVGVALLGFLFTGHSLFALIVVGLLAVGGGVAIQPSSPAILGLAALAGALAWSGLGEAWDSMRLLIGVMTAVAAAAALLMLLPRLLRRLVISLLILLHFGGIVTAVTSVNPSPWLTLIAWTYFYRHYLQFMYLNNAYHFYAPEPGPAQMVWFYVKYDDGSGRWFRIPQRGDEPLNLEYTRRLSLSESLNQLLPPAPVDPRLTRARALAGQRDDIPPYPGANDFEQRREPNAYSKRMLAAFAAHVAHAVPHPTDPSRPVTSVKIYRVVHNILPAPQIADGADPAAAWNYTPYYQGEYTPDGQLMDPDDPYLYWAIPILRNPQVPPNARGPQGIDDEDSPLVLNYLVRHARLPYRPAPAVGVEPLPPHTDK